MKVVSSVPREYEAGAHTLIPCTCCHQAATQKSTSTYQISSYLHTVQISRSFVSLILSYCPRLDKKCDPHTLILLVRKNVYYTITGK